MVAALVALPCARAAADAPLPPDYFGMNVNRVLFDDPQPGHAAALSAARAAGATHGRIDFIWGAVQPNGPQTANYWWTDAAVSDLVTQGIQPAPMLGYSAGWAASVPGNTKTPPRNLDDYTHFAQLMVLRYGPGGSFWRSHPQLPYLPVHRWEVWNEPNLAGFWQTGRDPGLYAQMYLATRAAIKAIDPGAQVIVGGLHSGDIAFLTDMYNAVPQLHGNVDGVGIHPYAPDVNGVLNAVRRFRAALDALGETSVPMEVTEIGWPRLGGTSLTLDESVRATDLSQVTNLLARSDCGIDAFDPYSWETAERDPSNGEDWYGMWSASQGLLPTGQAYATETATFSSPAARAAARSVYLVHICHPPPPQLSVSVGAAGSKVRFQVRVGRRGVQGALVFVRPTSRAKWLGLVTGTHGYAYYRPARSTARLTVAAAAKGFASAPIAQHALPRALQRKLRRHDSRARPARRKQGHGRVRPRARQRHAARS